MIAVDAVIDGDESDVLLLEENFRVKAHLQIVSSEAAHVLADDRADITRLDLGNHGVESGAIERNSRNAVVREMLDVVKTITLGVCFEIRFLVYDTVTLTL